MIRCTRLAKSAHMGFVPQLPPPLKMPVGGMKQKLLIAVALGRDARVLVMDEPVATRDAAARRIFFALLAVPGPDRLRFLGTLSRYVSVVSRVSLQEQGEAAARALPLEVEP